MDAAQTQTRTKHPGKLGRHYLERPVPGSDAHCRTKVGARVHLRAGLERSLELKVALLCGLWL